MLLILSISLSTTLSGQLISKKEAARVDQLLERLSEENKPGTYLIQDVNILTMTDSILLEEYDVLVSNGTIQQIAKDIVLGEHVQAIDAGGKFLLPGLTDMHVHLFDEQPIKSTWLLLFITHGITSVRDMFGQPAKLKLKEQIQTNEILGPNLYQSGPIVDGVQGGPIEYVDSDERAREVVHEHKEAGYDFIKIYNDLSKGVFIALTDEAQRLDIRVTGHVPNAVGLEDALDRMHSIEHMTGYFEWRNYGKYENEVYMNVGSDYAQKTAQSMTWNCPTAMTFVKNWLGKDSVMGFILSPEVLRYTPRARLKKIQKILETDVKEKTVAVQKYGANNFNLKRDIILNLYRANAKLVAGTDVSTTDVQTPGISLLDELYFLHKMGIPIYDVLKMSTINAAMALDEIEEFGTVEVGKRADLLLLDKNPLKDIRHLRERSGVMIRGIWLPKDHLDEILLEIQTILGND